MAEEGKKMGASIIPKEPKRKVDDNTKKCDEIMDEIEIEHKKYAEIVNKIKTGINRYFLIKCKVNKGEYYFLAEYKTDGFDEFFTPGGFFNKERICTAGKKITKEMIIKQYGDGPMINFILLHNKKDCSIKIGPPNKRLISYDNFKKNIIPINEAFMYKNMPSSISESDIVDYTNYMNKKEEKEEITELENVEHLIPDDDDAPRNVETGSGELPPPPPPPPPVPAWPPNEGQKVGGRKKRRKKRSRSKKRRGRRKNRTKKN